MDRSSVVRWSATVVALALALASARAAEDFRVGVSAGTSLPISDFGTFFDNGFGARALFAYEVNPGMFFTATAGFNRWTVDNQAINDAVVPVIGVPVELTIDGSLRSVPLMIGIRYSPLPKGIQPYLALEAGVHLLQLDLSGTVTTGPNVSPLPSSSDSWSAFGLAAGLGVAVPFARRWALEISATYSSVEQAKIQILEPDDPGSTEVSVQALRSYMFHAGVTYAF